MYCGTDYITALGHLILLQIALQCALPAFSQSLAGPDHILLLGERRQIGPPTTNSHCYTWYEGEAWASEMVNNQTRNPIVYPTQTTTYTATVTGADFAFTTTEDATVYVFSFDPIQYKRPREPDVVWAPLVGPLCSDNEWQFRSGVIPRSTQIPESLTNLSYELWVHGLDWKPAHGSGNYFTYRIPAWLSASEYLVRFYCDENSNGSYDQGEFSIEEVFATKVPKVYTWTFAQPNNAPSLLTGDEVEQIILGSELLITDKVQPDDNRCCIQIVLQGEPNYYPPSSSTPDVVLTQLDQLKLVANLNHDIMLVNDLQHCSGHTGSCVGLSLLGYPGSTIVVNSAQPHSLWAHEWGHVVGLEHSGPDNPPNNHLMARAEGLGNSQIVTQEQCQCFENLTPADK